MEIAVRDKDIAEWRAEWLEANDPRDGTDCVTPFDKYLYVTTNPADAFRNMFAILHNLDRRELDGIASDNNPWPPASLSSFVLKLDDARLDALWGLVQARQPERYRA